MDDGEPTQLSSTTRVVISVQDINDNAPEFDQKTYNVEIPSNAKINQKLFQVSFHRFIPFNDKNKSIAPLSDFIHTLNITIISTVLSYRNFNDL